jgi:hypothetical protein
MDVPLRKERFTLKNTGRCGLRPSAFGSTAYRFPAVTSEHHQRPRAQRGCRKASGNRPRLRTEASRCDGAKAVPTTKLNCIARSPVHLPVPGNARIRRATPRPAHRAVMYPQLPHDSAAVLIARRCPKHRHRYRPSATNTRDRGEPVVEACWRDRSRGRYRFPGANGRLQNTRRRPDALFSRSNITPWRSPAIIIHEFKWTPFDLRGQDFWRVIAGMTSPYCP